MDQVGKKPRPTQEKKLVPDRIGREGHDQERARTHASAWSRDCECGLRDDATLAVVIAAAGDTVASQPGRTKASVPTICASLYPDTSHG
jgi:hypothetical protein